MSKEKSPAFQFYPRDLLSDINWRMMNYPERGMYWELVSVCWLEKRLPADLGALARLLQVSVEQFESAWRMIGKCFEVDPKDSALILHPRLESERLKQCEWKTKCSKGGRNSAGKRKTKQQLIREQGSCDLLPSKPQLKVNSSSSSSSSSSVKEKEPPIVPQRGTTNGLDKLFVKFWESYPRHESKALAYKSFVKIHPDDRLIDRMVSWLIEAKLSEQWQDKNHIPHASTWLNQRRWEGDPPPKPSSKHEESLTEYYERLSKEYHETH